MPPRYASSKSTTSPDSQHKCSSHQTCEPKESTAPQSPVKEDDYREGERSLQSCKCDFDPSASLTHSLYNSNELLWRSISNFRSEESSPISLSGAGGGVYAIHAGRETRIDIQMREDAQMMHLSAVVHNATSQISEMPSNKTKRGSGGYMLLLTMMRYNSQLSRTACAARILACNGQFILFQDMSVTVLNKTGMLHRKLDEFILKTVEIRRGFDRILKEDHFR